MKYRTSTLIQAAIIGMGFGFPVTLLCMTLIGGFNSAIAEFLTWMAASALYGILTTVILDPGRELPFPAALALHCFGCFAVTVAAAAIIGYADSLMALVAGILPVFILVYVIVYCVCFAIMKHHERQINQALNQD